MWGDLSREMQDIQAPEAPRDFLNIPEDYEGTINWILRIDGCISKVTQKDQKVVILQAEVVRTNHPEQEEGHLVKQMWTLSGVDAWKKIKALGILKGIVQKMEGISGNPSEEELEGALSGGGESTMVGKLLKVSAQRKPSSKGTLYVEFSYLALNARDLASLEAPETTAEDTKTTTEEEESLASPEPVEVDLGSDEDPPF